MNTTRSTLPIWKQILTGLMLGLIVLLAYITPAVLADDPMYKIVMHFLTIWALWHLRKQIHAQHT
jgi:hypothetical protein